MEKQKSKSLLQILQGKNKYISAPCNGSGKCGKCVVQYKKGATKPSGRDREIFSKEQLEKGFRLACQSYPGDDYEVLIPQAEEEMEVVSDWVDRRQQETENSWKEDGFGICIDIGTTTLAGILVDMATGMDCQTSVRINHQRTYGADVLSRIQASNNGKKLEMQRCIRQDLMQLVLELVEKQQTDWDRVKKIVIAGNTTMCHLLLGFSCEKLGVAPFLPVDISWMEKCASDILGIKELDADVTILPGISAFVGADITAGVACCGLQKKEKFSLFLDIGTNGEMVLGNCEKMYAAATSAGPAFEGGNISCGMASVPGAISHVSMDEEKNAQFEIIASTKRDRKTEAERRNRTKQALGICGTGMIDLAGELRKHEIIDENGTFSDEYFDTGYSLTERVTFTQNDMRELQMAKGAIRAGIEILTKKAGIDMEEIEKCYLAGGFGTRLNIQNAVEIGLLPEKLKNKTILMGNTVLSGTKGYLLGTITRAEFEKIIAMTEEMNLADEPDFNKLYLQYMQFKD